MPKILIIGHYSNDAQESMSRYGDWLAAGFSDHGWSVSQLSPRAVCGSLKPSASGIGKYLGYIDKYIFFPLVVKRFLKKSPPDVICLPDHSHGMYLKHCGCALTVVHCHDLFALRAALGAVSHQPTGRTGRIYQKWIADGLKKAVNVCCVSEQTAVEFREIFPSFSGQLEVTPNGRNYPYTPFPDNQCRVALTSFRERFSLPAKPFLLHVGGNNWYKNRIGLVKAFAEYCIHSESDMHLWLVGKVPNVSLRSAIEQSGFIDRIHVISGATNEDLRLLYSTCEIFCFPSISEGFGWPVTEAQACGATVLTTEKAPMLEVGGDAAYYVAGLLENEEIPETWYSETAKKIAKIHERDPEQKNNDRIAALAQAQKFDSDKCFKRVLDFYTTIIQS